MITLAFDTTIFYQFACGAISQFDVTVRWFSSTTGGATWRCRHVFCNATGFLHHLITLSRSKILFFQASELPAAPLRYYDIWGYLLPVLLRDSRTKLGGIWCHNANQLGLISSALQCQCNASKQDSKQASKQPQTAKHSSRLQNCCAAVVGIRGIERRSFSVNHLLRSSSIKLEPFFA